MVYYSYSNIEKSIVEKYNDSQLSLVQKINEVLVQKFSQYIYMIRSIRTDPIVLKGIEDKFSVSEKQFIVNMQLREQIESYLLSSPVGKDIINIRLYIPSENNVFDGARIFKLEDDEFELWKSNNWVSEKDIMFFVDEQYERLNNKKIDCLSCIVKIGSLMDKDRYAYIRLDIMLESINKLISSFNINMEQEIHIIDNDFNIIVSTNKEKEKTKVSYYRDLQEKLKDMSQRESNGIPDIQADSSSIDMRNVYNIIIEDKNIIAQIKYTGFQDYTILIEMPYSYMLESLTDAKIQTAAVIFIAVSVYILLMVLFSNLFSRRIHKLIKKIEYFEKGELNVKLKIGGNDEISFIDKKLNEMAARLDKLIKEKYIAEIDRNKLKLDMLQEQMNPHFISNSLEVIGAMASLQGCDDVEMYIKKLGRMLRYNITADNDMIVPFGKEIAYIKQYIAIQQIRNQYNERGDSTINGLKSDVIKGLARANRLLDAMLFERDSKKQIGSKF